MNKAWGRAFALTLAIFGAASARAQAAAPDTAAPGMMPSPLLQIRSIPELRGEIDRRYQIALQATLSAEVIRAEDSRFVWASETKVACGIAMGYLKSRTIEPESITKCDAFARRLELALAAPTQAALPVPLPAAVPVAAALPAGGPCRLSLPVSIYFDWDVDAVPAEAQALVSEMAGAMQGCGVQRLALVGHADRSGSDAYNMALSRRRAANAAAMFEQAGVSASSLLTEAKGEAEPALATVDGISEPKNRRVEISSHERIE
jgi:OOP family OmpA-OmpF porin